MKQNQYEITYLIDPRTSEDARTSLNSAIDERITSLSGTVAHAAPILRKKLAYAIDRQDAAFMRVMNIEIAGEHVHELQDFLKRTGEILRTTIIATPERARISQELIEKHGKRSGKKGAGKFDKKSDLKKPAKEVTMQAVEKGIEEALTEEVK